MKVIYIFAMVVLMLLTGCEGEMAPAMGLAVTPEPGAATMQAEYAAHTQAVLSVAQEMAAAQADQSRSTAESLSATLTAAPVQTGEAALMMTQAADEARRVVDATGTQVSAERTAEAWAMAVQATNEYSAAQMVKTEQAQTTETAQAWSVAEWNRQGTQQSVVETARAFETQQPPTQTSVAMIQEAEATQIFAAAAESEYRAARQRIINSVQAWLSVLQVPAVILLIIAAGIWIIRQMPEVVKRDDAGMAPVLVMKGKVVDPERAVGPVTDVHQPERVPLGVQIRVTENFQNALARRQGGHVGIARPDEGPGVSVETVEGVAFSRPADWATFAGWDGVEIPLGVDEQGELMLQDPEREPHRLAAGKTGAGKSRYGMRAAIAGALARGWVVCALGDQAPVDFQVFDGHPNWYALQVDQTEHILPYLAGMEKEVKARLESLYAAKESTWGRAKLGPRVMLVIDEYAAITDHLDPTQKRVYFALTANLSRLARKAGVHLLAGAQNPTRDNIRPSVRRNMLTQVFAVADAQASRAVLEVDGAERLGEAQYLAQFSSGLVMGRAFAPADREILDYLNQHEHQAEQPPSVILTPLELLTAQVGMADDVMRLAEQIRPLVAQGLGPSAIAQRLGRAPGGAWYSKLRQAIDFVNSSSSSSDMARVGAV